MNLLAVNLSGPKPLIQNGDVVQTGIMKTPQDGSVFVAELGLDGDVQVDKRYHGGVDQAVYLYSQKDYDWFELELERPLSPGIFGENLTLNDFGTDTLYVGDRFQIGEVLLELTAPRIPCATFAARMDDVGFVKRFKEAERPGVYARVLQTGKLQAGDTATYIRGEYDVSVLELFRLYYRKESVDSDTAKRILAAPVAVSVRKTYEAQRGV